MEIKGEPSLFTHEREEFHKTLIASGLLSINTDGVATNADRGNRLSVAIAYDLATQLGATIAERQLAQTSGANFEALICDFVKSTFPRLQTIRPGKWEVLHLGNRSTISASKFAQYEHLEYLALLTRENSRLKTIIGNDYMVAPDVVVYRGLYTDEELNDPVYIVDDYSALQASLRERNGGRPILHASISAKWTMRSDRAQNSRTEALNLIRNRKGSLLHIVVVTGEPTPSRLASLALGTGDIDCMYHVALYELKNAVNKIARERNRPEIEELLETLIEGKRLKDISDLPLDLCV